ncbi:MAG: hypothetical protein WBB69_09870 [Anaerolineales bacterium]
MSQKEILLLVGLMCILFSSCSELEGQELLIPEVSETQLVILPANTPTPEPSATLIPTQIYTPTITPTVILDAAPLEIEFKAEDGQELSGIYYPADTNPAPVIVLMHWARGDQQEWADIAFWLQNRAGLIREPDYNHSWRSSKWYPDNLSDMSIGVFSFTFRECSGGCQSYLPAEWLLDVQAAMATAAGLFGVNSNQILTAGASIGADGAVDGCAWLNQSGLGECLGAYGLSPGSLLTVPFEAAAGELLHSDPPLPVYCLYGLRDDASVETCSAVPEAVLVDYGYIENHGFELFQPNQDPDPLNLMLEFISNALPE